jgi:hypothetical protein
MVRLPPGFVPTRFPGYYWNVEEKHLYSIKVTGELKPLAKFAGYTRYGWNHGVIPPGYPVSHEGRRRLLTQQELEKLTLNENEVHYVTVRGKSE